MQKKMRMKTELFPRKKWKQNAFEIPPWLLSAIMGSINKLGGRAPGCPWSKNKPGKFNLANKNWGMQICSRVARRVPPTEVVVITPLLCNNKHFTPTSWKKSPESPGVRFGGLPKSSPDKSPTTSKMTCPVVSNHWPSGTRMVSGHPYAGHQDADTYEHIRSGFVLS